MKIKFFHPELITRNNEACDDWINIVTYSKKYILYFCDLERYYERV